MTYKLWTPDEEAHLHSLVSAGLTVPEVAQKLGRTTNSVYHRTTKLGLHLTLGPVPEYLNGQRVIAALLPDGPGGLKVILECPDCGNENTRLLSSVKLAKSKCCIACSPVRKRVANPPRWQEGTLVGHFRVIKYLRHFKGGHEYLVQDTRCGCERKITSVPKRPFQGLLSLCPCPVRLKESDGYITWQWRGPKGDLVKVGEHRLVLMRVLGRELLPHESPHHINGVRDDNRPENLELWSIRQPPGQRVADKLQWAEELLRLYAPERLNGVS